MIGRAVPLGCLAPAWLFAWVTAIFLPSLLIALLPPHALLAGGNVLQETWRIADAIGPFAKLALGGVLAVTLTIASRLRARSLVVDCAIAMIASGLAMGATLALLPADLSAGFGVGLTGQRFDFALLPLYAIGAGAAGVVFALSVWSCERRKRKE